MPPRMPPATALRAFLRFKIQKTPTQNAKNMLYYIYS